MYVVPFWPFFEVESMPWAFSHEKNSTWALIKKVRRNSHSGPKKLAFSAVRRFPTFLPSSPTKVGFEAFLRKTAKSKSFPETHLKTFIFGSGAISDL